MRKNEVKAYDMNTGLETFPCAFCGSPVPVEEISRGLFCLVSHKRAFGKGLGKEERMLLLRDYHRKIVGDGRRPLNFQELENLLDPTRSAFQGPPENAPDKWVAYYAEIDAVRKKRRLQCLGNTID